MIDRHTLGLLKGLIEHGDPGRHLGIDSPLLEVQRRATEQGLIRRVGEILLPTALGRDVYNEHELDKMPQGRASLWQLAMDE